MPWNPFLMKKLLKSGICGSINSILMHRLLRKSQHLRLLFNEQYMNSNRVTPKRVGKKKKKKGTKTQLVKRRHGFSGSKHTLSICEPLVLWFVFVRELFGCFWDLSLWDCLYTNLYYLKFVIVKFVCRHLWM